MSEWTQEECSYMDYLDEVYPGLPLGGAGLLIAKGDPIAFQVGLQDWQAANSNRLEKCGSCGAYHRPDFDGDCRDDAERFPTPEGRE